MASNIVIVTKILGLLSRLLLFCLLVFELFGMPKIHDLSLSMFFLLMIQLGNKVDPSSTFGCIKTKYASKISWRFTSAWKRLRCLTQGYTCFVCCRPARRGSINSCNNTIPISFLGFKQEKGEYPSLSSHKFSLKVINPSHVRRRQSGHETSNDQHRIFSFPESLSFLLYLHFGRSNKFLSSFLSLISLNEVQDSMYNSHRQEGRQKYSL